MKALLRVGMIVKLKKEIAGCEDYYYYTSTVTDIRREEVYVELPHSYNKGKLNCSRTMFFHYFKVMDGQLELDFNV